MRIYKTLADLDFGKILFEASVQTQTGKELMEKYQARVMTSAVTCNIINSFLKEAKNCLYDGGVSYVYEKVANVVNDNKYSWALASTCEAIEGNDNSRNFLARKAVEQVKPLLEMDETTVVSYIKSGALKNVMHVENFRNIAKCVYRDQPIVENNVNYTNLHPISMVEEHNEYKYFEVLGNIYKVNTDEGVIEEANASEVTPEFIYISQLLESQYSKFDVEKEMVIVEVRNVKIEVSEQGKAIREMNGQRVEFTAEQLREQNNIYLSTIPHSVRNNVAQVLECTVKMVENFNNISVMDNVNIVSTLNDKFLLIEENGNALAKSIYSNRTTAWSVNDNIAKTLDMIKKNTRVDLTESFKEKIDSVIERVSLEEGKMIQENLEKSQIDERRKKIEELTERYKNDPVRLQMLSQIACELNEL